MCADCEVIFSWYSFNHPCPRSSSPPAQHPHDHRHHPAHDPAGAGADDGNTILSHLAVLELRPENASRFLKLRSHLRCSSSCRDGSRIHEPSQLAPSHLRCSNSVPETLPGFSSSDSDEPSHPEGTSFLPVLPLRPPGPSRPREESEVGDAPLD